MYPIDLDRSRSGYRAIEKSEAFPSLAAKQCHVMRCRAGKLIATIL